MTILVSLSKGTLHRMKFVVDHVDEIADILAERLPMTDENREKFTADGTLRNEVGSGWYLGDRLYLSGKENEQSI